MPGTVGIADEPAENFTCRNPAPLVSDIFQADSMGKPRVFISHVHGDEAFANPLETIIRKALLGGVEIFNTSNRTSLEAGDPWRDKIIVSLRDSASVLVLASPDSVASPWVNFEAGGAWVAGTRVVPCCIRGMTPTSLPAPLSHLQALNPSDPEHLRLLIKQLADSAGLDFPADHDYETNAASLRVSSDSTAPSPESEKFREWFLRCERRPAKYNGQSASGKFRVSSLKATHTQQTEQFKQERLKPGDSLTCQLTVDGDGSISSYHCFARGDVADVLESTPDKQVLSGEIRCLGQMKVYETDFVMLDEDRGISYPTAWLILSAQQAK
jgi:hypothetical protein